MPTQSDDVPDVAHRNSGPIGTGEPAQPDSTPPVNVRSFRMSDRKTDCYVVTIQPLAPFWAFGPFATLPSNAVLDTAGVDEAGACTMVFLAPGDS